MAETISCPGLRQLLDSAENYALFDVREQGEYHDRQIPGATSLPRRQIEFRLPDLAPNIHIPLVVYDGGDERALLAAPTMETMGFQKVSVLEGGLPAWIDAGYSTVRGVNVPSKAFGEKLHLERKIPEITPDGLRALRENHAELIILDARSPEEYRRFCIPGAFNVPGGDLILWAGALRRKPDMTVVVNCAGRTRSIVGTAALRRLGLANAYALKNGTMGWLLEGLELELNPTRETPVPPPESRKEAELLALRVAEEEEIPFVSVHELLALKDEDDRQIFYLIDVRSENEFSRGHIPGSIGIPAGQAVQRADDYIAVKNARIIFASNQQARSIMAAYWFRQMGFCKASVLQGGIGAWSESGAALEKGIPLRTPAGWEEAKRSVRLIAAGQLATLLESGGTVVLDVGTSLEFEAGHVPGSHWLSRGWLEPKVAALFPDPMRSVVMTCPNGYHSTLAARALARLGYANVAVLDGGLIGWGAGGYPIETGLQGCLSEPNDVILSPSLKGDKEAMKRYLEWETQLAENLSE